MIKFKPQNKKGATKEELLEIIGIGKTKIGMFEGDLEEGELEIGQVSSMINEIMSIEEIFTKLRKEYSEAIARMDSINKSI